MPSLTHTRHVHSRRIRRGGALLAPLFGLVLLTGCSGDREAGGGTAGAVAPDIGVREGQDSSAGDDSVADGDVPQGVPDGAPSEGGTVPENAPPGGTSLTEQIVRTGDITVDVDDITSAANRITAVVRAAGGNVGSDQRFGDATDGNADLVLRIPPDSFDDVLETISDLGEELSRSVAAEDVSTVVADVDARVESLQNSVDRLLALAAQAVSVSDLITIESELSARQSELESLQAQQRALGDQVSLATLSVRLSASSSPETEDTGFLASLSDGWNALLEFGSGLISVVGKLLPWLAALVVISLPLWFLVRRRRPRAGSRTPVDPVPAGDAAMATFGPAPTGPGSAGPATTGPVAPGAAARRRTGQRAGSE